MVVTSGQALPEDHLTAEAIAGREFAAARKGYDRDEVRAFLQVVASTLEEATERVADLERRLIRESVGSEGSALSSADDGEAFVEAVSAELWRDDVLADLDRRRRELNAEVVRLRAGRDRLRTDLSDVLSGLGEQLRLLDGALVAARAAGDLEEQRVRGEPPLSAEERRAELEAARLAGFVTVGSVTHGDAEATTPAEPEAPDAAEPEVPATAEESAEAGEGNEVGSLFERLRAERTTDQPAAGTGVAPL
jgi:DivIVA domain-containing protein